MRWLTCASSPPGPRTSRPEVLAHARKRDDMDEDSLDHKVSIGRTTRKAHDGLPTSVVDNSERDRFEVLVEDDVIGWQPYRRYRNHIVLMGTEIDPQWRGRGVSSALIDGVLE